jgi:hypothetical protein
MVNELGISRDDIKEWAMQSVKEAVEKELRGFDIKDKVHSIAFSIMRDKFYSEYEKKEVIQQAVARLLRDTVKITFEQKEENNATQKT